MIEIQGRGDGWLKTFQHAQRTAEGQKEDKNVSKTFANKQFCHETLDGAG